MLRKVTCREVLSEKPFVSPLGGNGLLLFVTVPWAGGCLDWASEPSLVSGGGWRLHRDWRESLRLFLSTREGSAPESSSYDVAACRHDPLVRLHPGPIGLVASRLLDPRRPFFGGASATRNPVFPEHTPFFPADEHHDERRDALTPPLRHLAGSLPVRRLDVNGVLSGVLGVRISHGDTIGSGAL